VLGERARSGRIPGSGEARPTCEPGERAVRSRASGSAQATTTTAPPGVHERPRATRIPLRGGDTPFIARQRQTDVAGTCTSSAESTCTVTPQAGLSSVRLLSLYYADGYPTDAPVLDPEGRRQRRASRTTTRRASDADRSDGRELAQRTPLWTNPQPVCPASFIASAR
jgi:hypothetical protein